MTAQTQADALLLAINLKDPRIIFTLADRTIVAAELCRMLDRIAELEAQPARQPLKDEEVQRRYAELQERLAAKQEALYQSRIGMQCGMCAEGRYQASSNGYSKFHRCDKCIHVPFWSDDGKEFTAYGITKEAP